MNIRLIHDLAFPRFSIRDIDILTSGVRHGEYGVWYPKRKHDLLAQDDSFRIVAEPFMAHDPLSQNGQRLTKETPKTPIRYIDTT